MLADGLVFWRCGRFGLVPAFSVWVSVVAAEIFLHHTELLFFLTLLEIEDLHLSFEAALLLPESLVL